MSHLLIRGAMMIDGSGASAHVADVRIRDGRIAEVGPDLETGDAEPFDAAGQCLAPGFIDVHTHDDHAVIERPDMLCKISQGVTAVVVGNCGMSVAPLVASQAPEPLGILGPDSAFRHTRYADYVAAVNEARPATNVVGLIGHSTVRLAVMEDTARPASGAERERMAELVEEAMAAGAAGMSSGVFYAPGTCADVSELACLAEVVAAYGGVYTAHIRDEYDGVLEALEEAFSVAHRAGLPVVISHHKCAGPKNWGRTRETLAYIERIRRRQPVAVDAYPYVAGSTVLREDLVDGRIDVLLTWSKPYPDFAGRLLADIAAEWNCSQQVACKRLQPGGACYFQMREDDIKRVLAYPHTMIGSDGLPFDSHPHPRLWGAFARVLGHYSRDEGLFPIEEAVRRMTGLPAKQFGLRDRGRIAPGCIADLALFDPMRIRDQATYSDPEQPASGLTQVWVGGIPAYSPGTGVVARNGRFLRRDRSTSDLL
ncbi:hypothetical protein X994_6501 (plasmid) [Burkholderia pseudomallei]|uniref:N-acyl-D-amino-acid deacylase family protein n=1 Tax=Burkholderia pseudomallei TaxID=28450 RepID=UPI00050E7F1B|nr:D-aminoacylase [Burkholderia pseudomallei]AIV73841.1 hypothetical protein X994_6501 [Burkholderia pseudomallei]KGD54753.1 amidohydrolase family protein [Burkholderia pseudomallei]